MKLNFITTSHPSTQERLGKGLAQRENRFYADMAMDDGLQSGRGRYRSPQGRFCGAVVLTAAVTVAALAVGLVRMSPSVSLKRPNVSNPMRSEPRDGRTRALTAYYSTPMRFEANRGQMDAGVKFIARGHASSYLLTERGAIMALVKGTPERATRGVPARARTNGFGTKQHSTVVRMAMVGANPRAPLVGAGELVAKTNYYPSPRRVFSVAPDRVRVEPASPSFKPAVLSAARVTHSPASVLAPITDVPNYVRVIQRNIYPGIDLVYYLNPA